MSVQEDWPVRNGYRTDTAIASLTAIIGKELTGRPSVRRRWTPVSSLRAAENAGRQVDVPVQQGDEFPRRR
jgi:hypothetical protein